MNLALRCFIFLFVSIAFSQEKDKEILVQKNETIKIDSLYREDQFYVGFTYNLFKSKDLGIAPSKFSTGYSFGFLRDMPVNKSRTVAVAAGLGFSYNNYNQNLQISQNNENRDYRLLGANEEYSKNKFSQVLVDFPLEFRWRNSTFESHEFFRIYAGIKFSYLLYDQAIYEGSQGKIGVYNNPDFNKFTYGVYLGSGYNTWNLYAFYGLNSMFKNAALSDKNIDVRALNLGLIFYIL
jgi:hypothetical protein